MALFRYVVKFVRFVSLRIVLRQGRCGEDVESPARLSAAGGCRGRLYLYSRISSRFRPSISFTITPEPFTTIAILKSPVLGIDCHNINGLAIILQINSNHNLLGLCEFSLIAFGNMTQAHHGGYFTDLGD
jgi:hypothetical protein